MNKTYIDNQGYLRFKDSKNLVHRWVAYNQVYKKNKEKYTRPFKDYQVHHRDKNKLNNDPDNLELITHYEHTIKHKAFNTKEWLIIKSFATIILMLFFIFLYMYYLLMYKLPVNWKTMIPIFILIILDYFWIRYINKKTFKRYNTSNRLSIYC